MACQSPFAHVRRRLGKNFQERTADSHRQADRSHADPDDQLLDGLVDVRGIELRAIMLTEYRIAADDLDSIKQPTEAKPILNSPRTTC